MSVRDIQIAAFDYELPDERIAKYPLLQRDQSKLLVWKGGEIKDESFGALPNYIPQNTMMVFNNTKVIQARLRFQKATGAAIEIFCLEPQQPHDYQLSFQTTEHCSWLCMVGNSKKWKEGELLKELVVDGRTIILKATRETTLENSQIITFSWQSTDPMVPVSFAEILHAAGELPIPPYLNRDTEESDLERYQTTYSKIDGSVAAPTAGLHFTPAVFDALRDHQVSLEELTLHVGAGTFKPVKSATIGDHAMHTEFIAVPLTLIRKLAAHQGLLVAVGTTSVRTLESLYYLGAMVAQNPNLAPEKLQVPQWMPYESSHTLTSKEALDALISYLTTHKMETLLAETQIMIVPGYRFKLVKGIVTNFHQPQSTLLLLISAFLSQNEEGNLTRWRSIYDHALTQNYRFLSYGDSSLLLP